MSSNASERPPRDKTSRPFATLSHDKSRSTGPRPKISQADELSTDFDHDDSSSVGTQGLSAEFLSSVPPNSVPPNSLPPNIASPGIASSPRRSMSPPTRANPSQCRKHQIQRNRSGVCLLCAKEAAAAKGKSKTWPIVLCLAAVLGLAVAVAFFLERL